MAFFFWKLSPWYSTWTLTDDLELDINRKVLSQGIIMWNMKDPTLTNWKIWLMLKILQTNKWTIGRTSGQAKNYIPLIYRWGGIKNIGNTETDNITHSLIHHFEIVSNSKFNEAADDNWNVAIKDCREKTSWKKVKLLILSNFTFLQNVFLKLFVLKCVYMEKRVNCPNT